MMKMRTPTVLLAFMLLSNVPARGQNAVIGYVNINTIINTCIDTSLRTNEKVRNIINIK